VTFLDTMYVYLAFPFGDSVRILARFWAWDNTRLPPLLYRRLRRSRWNLDTLSWPTVCAPLWFF